MHLVNAHFDGKVFVPDEPVDLPKDAKVVLQVEIPQPAGAVDALGWMAENAVSDQSIPADLSKNLDHYLYGKAKQVAP